MCRVVCRAGLFALALAVLLPTLAAAQAVGTTTIAGTVTDSSGGAMPGVTVEASSPALIEGSRSAVTNEAGRYSIVNLRPGVYTVTFTLSGFRTTRRENVELTSDFTAAINAQLQVGGVEEVVTVEASTPIVDVQGVAAPRVYTRDMLDALPTGRTPDSLMNTLPGATPGFFGTQFRGTQDSLTMVDGMRATLMIGAGPGLTTASSNSNMYQEMSFSTSIDSVEAGQPGIRINLVPRDGGNQFRGSSFFNYTRAAWQTSNVDADLRAQGIGDPAKTLRLWDVNPTFGGPIVRDKVWFQSSYRWNTSDAQNLGSYFDADPSPTSYVADLSKAGISDSKSNNFVQRVTWQVNPKDKISAFYDWDDSSSEYFYNFLLSNPGSPISPNGSVALASPNDYNLGLRWTRPQTSRLLFEGSFINNKGTVFNNYRDAAEPWSAKYVEEGLPTTLPTSVGGYAIHNASTGSPINLARVSDANISHTTEVRGSATYVTGSHSLKFGASFFKGDYHRPTSVIGYAPLEFAGAVPAATAVTLTLPGNEKDNIDGDWAFYVQDRWTVKQLTVNAGVRMDWLYSSTPDQVLPASPWLSRREFEAKDILNYKDLSPRVGVAYDLFGNGKTAVKAALARYVAGETVALTGQANPIRTISTSDRRSWNDLNGDGSPFNADYSFQVVNGVSEVGPTGNTNFGSSIVSTSFDPEVLNGWFNRGYSWETNVSVQHELLPGVGVNALYYRRTLGNQRINDNTLIDTNSYDGPFCVTGPNDSRLPGGANAQVCGLYDLKPQFRGLVSNLNTFVENLGTGAGRDDITTGYEFQVTTNLRGGVFLSGGLNFQNVHINTCDPIDSPEGHAADRLRFCDTDSGYRPDFKLNGSYMLPYEVQIAATYRGLAGPEVRASWAAPNAVIRTGLGRDLTGGAFTKTVPLMDIGQEFFPMRHIFDARFSKGVSIDRYRFQVMADLYNLFNTNAISGINNTFGNRWQFASGVQSPRQFRLSAQIDF